MTLEEACAFYRQLLEDCDPALDSRFKQATKILLEAGERIREYRRQGFPAGLLYLPSETKEEKGG